MGTALAPGHQTYLTEGTSLVGLEDQRTTGVTLAGISTLGPGTQHAGWDHSATAVTTVSLEQRYNMSGSEREIDREIERDV